MRFKVDENLPQEAAESLRQAGHDAATVLEQQCGGSSDERLIVLCRAERRILVTLDLDFADIRAYPPDESPGTIVLRLRAQDKLNVLAVLERLMPLLAHEPLAQRLWIVEERRIRIR